MNPYRGEVRIQFNGKPQKLVYDWEAMAALATEFGEDWYAQWGQKFGKDWEFTAKFIAIGLSRHLPDITHAKVLKASPAVIPTLQAAAKALNLGMYGQETVPKDLAADPQTPPAASETT